VCSSTPDVLPRSKRPNLRLTTPSQHHFQGTLTAARGVLVRAAPRLRLHHRCTLADVKSSSKRCEDSDFDVYRVV
jgi:hypothetical protein